MDDRSFASIFLSFQWTYGRGRCMLQLLDISDSWLARFMFKRSLDAAANEMEQQAYMQGKIHCAFMENLVSAVRYLICIQNIPITHYALQV